jgi:hypothetical protein
MSRKVTLPFCSEITVIIGTFVREFDDVRNGMSPNIFDGFMKLVELEWGEKAKEVLMEKTEGNCHRNKMVLKPGIDSDDLLYYMRVARE